MSSLYNSNKVIMGMFKYITIGLMLISAALALGVQMPDTLTLSEGEAKTISINVTNNLNEHNIVGISVVYSNFVMPPLLSTYLIDMSSATSANITAKIDSKETKPGSYLVRFLFASTAENIVFSRAINVTIRQAIEVTPVYSYVSAAQGDFVVLKFIITNTDKSGRNMYVDPDSFPSDFKAVYPDPFYLDADESKTISIKLSIPGDYMPGTEERKIVILSGEIRTESRAFDLSITRASSYRNVVNIAAVELGGYIGNDSKRGYNIMLRVDNRKSEPITDVEVTGFPLGWNVSGDTPFTVGANSVKDINIRVIPTDYDDHKLDVLLTKNSIVLANTTMTFSGRKAGLVAQAFLGGSLTIGLLVIVIMALVLLYVRQKNTRADVKEKKVHEEGYLKKLFDEAKKQL